MWPVYGAEILVAVKNGEVIKQQEFKYPTARRFEKEEIEQFIYTNINWYKIPDMGDEQHRIVLSFESGASGKAENGRSRRTSPCPVCDEEALRVLSQMPWPTDYGQGKVLPVQTALILFFSEALRKKYKH